MALIARQTRIFVPPEVPYEDGSWVETLLGRVVEPLSREPSLGWFWFSRYWLPLGEDTDDCDFSRVPESFMWPGPQHRSVRFRYAIAVSERARFEAHAQEVIDAADVMVTDFRDFPWIDDLGSERFLGEEVSKTSPEQRAELVTRFLHATSALVLDCLDGPDVEGRYRAEVNGSQGGSSFRVPLHMFCNMTQVPVVVRLDAPTAGSYNVALHL